MATTVSTPALESGDRLTRAEFHRRYRARPDIPKAELIDGVVYVTAATRSEEHAKPHGVLAGWLALLTYTHPGVEFRDTATVFLTGDGEVQPDLLLFRPPPLGRVRRTEDGYLEGAPDLIVEIAASSASYDLHDKKALYERAGVPEYLVWRTVDGALDWFDLHEGRYVRREPDASGAIESRAFPGLRLNVARLPAGEYATVLTVQPGPEPPGR
jgi:Uma2 family endonuclease